MSKKYTQLTEIERYHNYLVKKPGYSNTAMARGLGRSRTTAWREVQLNSGHRFSGRQYHC